MNELDPKTKYDPTFLFIRADERTEAVEIAVKDLDKEMQHTREDLLAFRHHFDQRVENGVALTGQRNSTQIGELTTRVTLLEREYGELKAQLLDPETGALIKFEERLKDLSDWISTINKLAIGFIVTGCAGSLILWAVHHYR